MKIHAAPRGKQDKLRGNVVNVPANVSTTLAMLPRPVSEDATIHLHLKRHLSFQHHYLSENVRPLKICLAAQYLTTNCALFKKEGITFNNTWFLPIQQPGPQALPAPQGKLILPNSYTLPICITAI